MASDGRPLIQREIELLRKLSPDRPAYTAPLAKQEERAAAKREGEPWISGDASFDNAGSRSTGDKQASVNMALNSPLTDGDRLSVSNVYALGSEYVELDYSLPIASGDWRIGGRVSRMFYRLIAPELKEYQARGNATGMGLDLDYQIASSKNRNLKLSVKYDANLFSDKFSGAVVNDYRVDSGAMALGGKSTDTLAGGGTNKADLSLHHGLVNLGGSPNHEADSLTVRTGGHFSKFRYSLSREQTVTEEISLFGAVSGQLASRNLAPSEQFFLGGPGGVRAYPADEGAGSEGLIANLELRWTLPESLTCSETITLVGFYDWGRAGVNVDNEYPGRPAPNSYALQGGGVSVVWASSLGIEFTVMWAHRVGENPNPNARGADQDNSLVRNRLWLVTGLSF